VKVALINPPFASYYRPSIALAQLQSASRSALPHVPVHIHNINLDCVPILGPDWYTEVSDGFQSWTGLGDWLFRPLAFPSVPDNAGGYLQWLRSQVGSKFGDHLPDLIVKWRDALCSELPEFVRKRAIASYDVVGVTSMFAQNLAALAILRMAKTLNPSVITVMGGANCESPMGDALLEKFTFIDRVFSGRAAGSFATFLKCYDRTRSLQAIPPIEGVLSRPATGAQVRAKDDCDTAEQSHATSTSAAPPPRSSAATRRFEVPSVDYDAFIEELSTAPFETELVLPFETSIGCWWGEKSHCTFCGLNSNTMEFRALEPDEAVALINCLVRRYSSACKKFEACDNILSHKYFSTVLPRLEVPEDVSLFYEIKANLSEAHVRTLAAAQVRRIQPGIESLSTVALRLLRKGVDALRNVMLLRNCRTYGIWVDWNVLVAIPGESAAIYEQTLKEAPKLVHLEPPACAFRIRYDRFSPYFKFPEKFGLRIAPFEYYSFLYPFEESWRSQLAYFFEDAPDTECRPAAFRNEIARVEALIDDWKARWTRTPHPILECTLEDDRTVVVDGRGDGPVVCHVLDGAQAGALSYFRQPRHFLQAQNYLQMSGLDADAAAAAIAFLRASGWLFEEGAQAVSIVTGREADIAPWDVHRERDVASQLTNIAQPA
jgi:magnesium-protoporphyrin IX monomethyl ester (oxidative) cyclase